MDMPLVYILLLTATCFAIIYLVTNYLAKRASERKERARQAIIQAHLRRIELMKSIAEIECNYKHAMDNISHDCLEVTREQAN